MELLALIILGCTAIIGIGAAVVLWRKLEAERLAAEEMQKMLAAQQTESATAIERARQFEKQAEILRREAHANGERAAKADTAAAVARQEVAGMKQRIEDHEAQKKQMTEAASAAVLKTAQDVSTKLLEDHKQESEAAKKHHKELSDKFLEQFTHVTGRVEAMQKDSEGVKGSMEVVMRALSNPGGAGKHNEINLENILKSFDFLPGIDFDMQYHMPNVEGGLKPDAIVYLPQNMVLVVDGKASQFVMQMVEAEGTPEEGVKYDQLRKSMHQHVKALAGKKYDSALRQHYKSKGWEGEISEILNVMYFHNEGLIERMREEDNELVGLLKENRIILAGPTMLFGLCELGRSRLAEAKRAKEHDAIIEAVAQLMETFVSVMDAAKGMGKGIKTIGENYSRMLGLLNRNGLPRMRKLGKLKVYPAKGKEMPSPLPLYELLCHEEVLDMEPDEDNDKVLAIR